MNSHSKNILDSFSKIKTFIFDIDGVLTNGSLLVLENGVLARTMNVKDGYALHLAAKKEYNIFIISGGGSTEVEIRLKNIGIHQVFMKVMDKALLLKELIEINQLKIEEILFMGDDVPDLEAMKLVGLACCPKDAVDEIKEISHYISYLNGGSGCVREVIEKVLKLQNNWDNNFQIPSL